MNLVEWARSANAGRDIDKRALIALAQAAGETPSLHPADALNSLSAIGNMNCDKAWRIFERLETKGLIRIAYACGVPASLDLCIEGGRHAV